MVRFITVSLAAAVLAASPCAALAAPAADRPAPPLSVSERITLAQWSARVEKLLDARLEMPFTFNGEQREGTVRVKFNCSESGAPAAVSIAKSSGSYLLDRAALRAVSRISSLHPLPTGLGHDQKYVALVVFGSDEDSVAEIRRSATKLNSWYKDPAPVSIALAP